MNEILNEIFPKDQFMKEHPKKEAYLCVAKKKILRFLEVIGLWCIKTRKRSVS